MTTKQKDTSTNWEILGGPKAGSAAALSIVHDKAFTAFVGTSVGLFRSTGITGSKVIGWERLTDAPVGIMSLAISPNYNEDCTIIAGTHSGLYVSYDGGNTWHTSVIPISNSMILAICFSPNYMTDGIVMAGTLEDGVFYTDNRGRTWSSKDFGLLDPTVLTMSISPNFEKDETIYVGTDTGIFHSYNGARAWVELKDYPHDSAPVLCLAISPDYMNDQTIFVGTETSGLLRSSDAGKNWEKLNIPAACINALVISNWKKNKRLILAATENGIYRSENKGDSWDLLVNVPDAISLTQKDGLTLTGLVDQGVYISDNLTDWQPVTGLAARSLTSLTLSQDFEKDGMALIYGPQEGIWRTDDGGHTWNSLNATIPSLDINSVVLSPTFKSDHQIIASSPDGILLSEDGGENWGVVCDEPTGLMSYSPDGRTLVCSFLGEGIKISKDNGRSWKELPGPWDVGGDVVGLSVTNNGYYYVGLTDSGGGILNLWQGIPDQWNKVFSHPVEGNSVVSFWILPEHVADRPWYAAISNKVWRFSSRAGSPRTEAVVGSNVEKETILTMTGVQSPTGLLMVVSTGQRLYHSIDGKIWTLIHDFGSDRALSITLSPSFLNNKRVYALMLGGLFCKGIIR